MTGETPSECQDGRLLRRSLDVLETIVGAEPLPRGRRRALFQRCEAAAERLERLAKELDEKQYQIARDLAAEKSDAAVNRFRRIHDLHNSALMLVYAIVPLLRHVDAYRARNVDAEPIANAADALARVFDELRRASG